jgi:hypothetical protein
MDHFSLIKMFSAILIFSGVFLVTRSRAKPEKVKGPIDILEEPTP